jgi:ribosomal protein S27E
MGTLLQLACEHCGHVQTIYEGVGMAGVSLVPVRCRTCEEIVSIERGAQECPECNGDELAPWAYHPDESQFDAECPQCARTAQVEASGIWD